MRAFVDLVLRRFWIITATFVLTLALTALGTAALPAVYEATSTIRLATVVTGSLNSVDYDLQYADRLMNTYTELATSVPILDTVSEELRIDEPPDVSADILANTELIAITGRSDDPETAASIANRVAEILLDYTDSPPTGEGSDDGLTSRLSSLEDELAEAREDYDALFSEFPADSPVVRDAFESLSLLQERYVELLSQIQAREALQIVSLSIIERAQPSESPESPNLGLNLALGGIVGLIAAFGLAFWMDSVDTTVQDKRQLQELTDVPVVAVFGRRPSGLRWPNDIPKHDASFDAARRLRTALAAQGEPSPLLIAAAGGPGRATAFIATHLAIAAAQAGRETVLVDANLRSPIVSKAFEIDTDLGVTDVVDPASNWEDLVSPTGRASLFVVTAGSDDVTPDEVLESGRTRIFLEWLDKRFDLVIVIAPDVLTSADAIVLSDTAEAVLLVVTERSTRRSELSNAVDELSAAGARPAGLVLSGG